MNCYVLISYPFLEIILNLNLCFKNATRPYNATTGFSSSEKLISPKGCQAPGQRIYDFED